MQLKDEVLAQFPTHPFERAMPALQFYSTGANKLLGNGFIGLNEGTETAPIAVITKPEAKPN